jgi:hypothetical protein
MSDSPVIIPAPPNCPLCTVAMALKTVYRQKPRDHYIFKCAPCELEYPVVGAGADARGTRVNGR